ncbi:MAG: hypothetical protein AAFP15_15790 [Bacteroidota bacterium]
MTHIIGTPPEPKRGATFADVPEDNVFFRAGHRWVRLRSWLNLCGATRNARKLSGLPDTAWFDPDEPVTLLTQPTPVEPEPDAAVTTYGELKPDEVFALRVTPGSLCWRTDDGHVYGGCAVTGMDPQMPVRRVPASLVVHEEPGSANEWPSVGQLLPDSDVVQLLLPEGVMGMPRARAEALCSQLAWTLHALAQRDAKPDTPAEPVEHRRTSRFPPGSAESDPLVQALAADLEAMRRFNEYKPESAEDRTKPAPGWAVVNPPGSDCWHGVSRAPCRATPTRRDYLDAVRDTWREHDAAQAREDGGE